MRRLAFLAFLLTAACSKRPETPATIEGPAELASAVRTADPATATQLVSGFHEIEQNSWRWTAHAFSVKLKPPFEASAKGATLTLQFSIPDSVLAKTGPLTLSARIGTAELPRETYSQPGAQSYTAAVPASALGGNIAKVDFVTDKFLAAGTADKRELAVIVSTISLETAK